MSRVFVGQHRVKVRAIGPVSYTHLEYAATIDTENEEMMKALVVEKSSTMRSVLRRILSMRGFEVTEAGDVKGALDALNLSLIHI